MHYEILFDISFKLLQKNSLAKITRSNIQFHGQGVRYCFKAEKKFTKSQDLPLNS